MQIRMPILLALLAGFYGCKRERKGLEGGTGSDSTTSSEYDSSDTSDSASSSSKLDGQELSYGNQGDSYNSIGSQSGSNYNSGSLNSYGNTNNLNQQQFNPFNQSGINSNYPLGTQYGTQYGSQYPNQYPNQYGSQYGTQGPYGGQYTASPFNMGLSLTAGEDTAEKMLSKINAQREKKGLQPLKKSLVLMSIAAKQATLLSSMKYRKGAFAFPSYEADGRSFPFRLSSEGYKGKPHAENWAIEDSGLDALLNLWLNNSNFRANLLMSAANEFGFSAAVENDSRLTHYVLILGSEDAN